MTMIVREAILSAVLSPEPSFTVWSRLEPLPTSADLGPGLQARVADPLWLLGRQWQFGELQGEDAGSPIDVRVRGRATPLARFAPGPPTPGSGGRGRDLGTAPTPLEVIVEREPIRATHPRLAAEAGLQFLRFLEEEGVGFLAARYRAAPAFALEEVDVPDPEADPVGGAWATLLAGRALDGRKLADAFRALADPDYVLCGLPPEPPVPSRARRRLRRAAGRWLRWYDESIEDPSDPPQSWRPARQEYAFAVSTTVEEGPVVLAADEYTDGRLDWYSFRTAAGPGLGEAADAAAPVETAVPPSLPVPVRYPGMAADRYWEFEDARVNFAEMGAGPTDLVRMLLIEFALAFGNDWFVVPVPLPVGSIFQITECTVRDTFGVVTPVGRSRDTDGVAWSMFELSTAPDAPAYLRGLSLLPPALPRPLSGDPVEEVALLRDEMANLVWGVERRVQGPTGEPVDRYLQASRAPVHQRLVDPPPDVRLVYRLGSPVPEHWIPFVPVPAVSDGGPAGVQLERRVLLRFDASGASRPVHPRGILLRSDPAAPPDVEPPLRLEEEEVPREGAVVQRSFQYARGTGGEAYLWLGRRKRVGRGEGSSLLRYDVAERVGVG